MEAREAGITSDTGRQKIKKARGLIVAHLQKEDRELYPKLKTVTTMGIDYQKEMVTLSQDVIAFFDAWETGELTGFELAKRTGSIVGNLRARITREETQLYPKYSEHFE